MVVVFFLICFTWSPNPFFLYFFVWSIFLLILCCCNYVWIFLRSLNEIFVFMWAWPFLYFGQMDCIPPPTYVDDLPKAPMAQWGTEKRWTCGRDYFPPCILCLIWQSVGVGVEWMGDLYLCMMDHVNLYVNVGREKKNIIINVEIKLIVLFYPFY